jgi:hypothetical protein
LSRLVLSLLGLPCLNKQTGHSLCLVLSGLV